MSRTVKPKAPKAPVELPADVDEEIRRMVESGVAARSLSPSRLATFYERLSKIFQAEAASKKKGAQKGAREKSAREKAASALGTTVPKAQNILTVLKSPLVSDQARKDLEDRTLSPHLVIEAVEYAQDQARREGVEPTSQDVDLFLLTAPRRKRSVSEILSQTPPPPPTKPAKKQKVEKQTTAEQLDLCLSLLKRINPKVGASFREKLQSIAEASLIAAGMSSKPWEKPLPEAKFVKSDHDDLGLGKLFG